MGTGGPDSDSAAKVKPLKGFKQKNRTSSVSAVIELMEIHLMLSLRIRLHPL